MIALLLVLFVGTFASEDLACVAAGALASGGEVPLLAAVVSCAAGIYVGDLGLWVAGRVLGSRVLAWRAVRSALLPAGPDRFAEWFEEHAAGVILGSRVIPGTRLPLYLMAGATGASFSTFARWTAAAVALWAPMLVIASAVLDHRITSAIEGWLLAGRVAAPLVMLIVPVFARVGARLLSKRNRQRLSASIAKIWRWEFWPMWLFYAPVGLWTMALAIRHGGFRTITAANPGIADGGVVGESKFDIVRRLPHEWTIPSALVAAGDRRQRLQQLRASLEVHQWSFPVVLKPDAGQRGTGVRLVASMEEAESYLMVMTDAVLVQPYHPGPFEAGVFYYRMPGAAAGRILAITDKHFPVLIGDGRSSIEDLIWMHERYRMQAKTFLARLGERRHEIPAAGTRVAIGMAGNHAQGAMFTDGFWMCTAALEARIDAIARQFPGFFIGRFDVRYSSREEFMAGRDLAIVELNGATAECTNIYDPGRSLVSAYRTLFRQWQLVFAIGAANRRAGSPVSPRERFIALVGAHLRSSAPFPVSD